MNKTSHVFLFGALILLVAGCAGQKGTSTPVGTAQPGDLTSLPTEVSTEATGTAGTETPSAIETSEATSTTEDTSTTVAGGTEQTPGIPVTGGEVILLERQFCVDTIAHALLVIPADATFEIDTASASLYP